MKTKEEIAAYQKQWRKNNRDKELEKKRIKYKNNKNERKEYQKKYRVEHKKEIAIYHKEYNKEHKKEIKEYKAEKYKINRKNILLNKKEYYKKNIDKQKEYKKKYRIEYKEKIAIYNKEYKKKYNKKNKEEIKRKKKIYIKERLKNDLVFKIRRDISSNMYNLLKNINSSKGNIRFIDYLGCTKEEFKIYIEKQFEEWMNWNNHSNDYSDYNINWEYDHIIPTSLAKTKEQIIILNNYLNQRPFCSLSNLEKNNKIDYCLINSNLNLVNHLFNNKKQLENIIDFNKIK